ncbi:MAG: PQQ-binding-like beta-propeller repeat protein [Chloroflexi bacterium]|nr:PQQ-binding-like beta-propeller repeat protein [Chloroflexota bacterium]
MLTAILLLGALAGAFTVAAGDQPQWGQRYSRNMVSDEAGLAETFDPKTGRNIKWSVPLGTETHSTPVVAGGRVLIGTNNGEPRDPRHQGDRGVLMCFDEKDGRYCWQLVVPKRTPSLYWDWPNSGICSPATVEGDRVYIVSNRGEVMCLDLYGQANGNDGPYREESRHCVPPGAEPAEMTGTDADILWLFDVPKELGVRQHDAAHCSILLHGQFLYVCTSNGVDDTHKHIAAPDAPSLIVLDKATGQLVAQDGERIGPRVFHSTWSSPALGEVAGKPLVIFAGGDGVVYAFETVERPARVGPRPQAPERPAASSNAGTEENAAPAPTVAKLKKVWWFDCDPAAPKENVHRYNGNRRESPSNIKGMPVFHQGRVYVASGGDLWWGKNQAWLKCIDATQTGDITKTGELWSYLLERHCMSTPAVHEGQAFIADCGHTVHCVDAETGRPFWTHETKGEVWGSTLVADGKVYIGTKRGDFWVLAASKEKKVLASIELGSSISASPVAANGALYVATMNRLNAVQKGAQASRPAR